MNSISLSSVDPTELFEKLFALPEGTVLALEADSYMELKTAEKKLKVIARLHSRDDFRYDFVCFYLDAAQVKLYMTYGISENVRVLSFNPPLQREDGSATL